MKHSSSPIMPSIIIPPVIVTPRCRVRVHFGLWLLRDGQVAWDLVWLLFWGESVTFVRRKSVGNDRAICGGVWHDRI